MIVPAKILTTLIVASVGLTAVSTGWAASAATLSPAGEGRRLWLKLNCYSCHGMHGEGGMGPKLRGDGVSYGDVAEVVLQGEETGMPSFHKFVNATDLKNLTAYLNSLGTPGEPKFVDWWVANPLK